MWEFECVPSSVAAIEDARRDDTHVGAKKKGLKWQINFVHELTMGWSAPNKHI